MSVSRRAVPGGLAAGLAGCGGPAAPPSPAASSSVSVSAAPGPSPAPSALPPRAEVVARYGGQPAGRWGTDVAGVIGRLPGEAVALTFDACGGPGGNGCDEALLRTLRQHAVPATLFVNARWLAADPGRARELAADPLFELANHGTAHRPLSVDGRSAYGIAGTRGVGEVYDEVAANHRGLAELTGRPPRFFRSGTAHYDETAVRVVGELGERVAGFTVNADAGATFTPAEVRRALAAVRPGAVVIAHVNRPGRGTAAGFAAALPELLGAGRRFVRLSDGVDHLG
ncbi:polysaccharide deacetylase family protein [Kitasatospora sp. NPDC051853]|uniref:polysaccharide deacetylase family protein n=1 Tax=Kitasatospora sp. NPDC051853 TaxID=3364058 RepID=UPI0037AB1465